MPFSSGLKDLFEWEGPVNGLLMFIFVRSAVCVDIFFFFFCNSIYEVCIDGIDGCCILDLK